MFNKKEYIDDKAIHIPIWMKVMPFVETCNLSQLRFKLDISYAHLHNVTHKLKEKGWLSVSKQKGFKNANKYEITDKAKKISQLCRDLLFEINNKK